VIGFDAYSKAVVAGLRLAAVSYPVRLPGNNAREPLFLTRGHQRIDMREVRKGVPVNGMQWR